MNRLRTTSKNAPGRAAVGLSVAVASALAFCWTGCAPEPETPPDRYQVRGVVSQLPSSERRSPELFVHHESISAFRNVDGELVGMDSMTMGFPLADAGLADGLEVGDKIEMEFEVRWSGGNPLAIVGLQKLPPETRLAFETDPEPSAGGDDGGESPDAEHPADEHAVP